MIRILIAPRRRSKGKAEGQKAKNAKETWKSQQKARPSHDQGLWISTDPLRGISIEPSNVGSSARLPGYAAGLASRRVIDGQNVGTQVGTTNLPPRDCARNYRMNGFFGVKGT